jgi:hypothetical protein
LRHGDGVRGKKKRQKKRWRKWRSSVILMMAGGTG